MAIEHIKVPDLGDASDVEVIELLVAVGDTVAENDSLLVLESDKAAMEIPAPMAGTIKSIAVNLGDQVSTGADMMTLEVEAGADAGAEEPEASPAEDRDANAEAEPADSAPDEDADAGDSGGSGGTEVVEVPDIGSDDEVDVIEVHVKEGDSIAADDALITLESDKAAMEVPATSAGTVKAMLLKVGDKAKTGTAILELELSGPAAKPKAESGGEPESGSEDEKAAPAPASAAKAHEPASSAPSSDPNAIINKLANPPDEVQPKAPSAGGRIYAGPAVRKLARELGVDLTLVSGSGAKNRIVKEDIHAFVKQRMQAPAAASAGLSVAIPDIDFSQFGEIETVERSRLEKLTAVNMQRNWNAIPHVAQFNEADVTDLEDFRAELKPEAEKRGTKLTFLPFLLKVCAKALAEYPQFNVSLHSSGEYVIKKKYFHIGMAVATPAGLVVPVIRDVDKKSIWELAEEVLEMSAKARDRKLTKEDMQGACFTISSLGAIGGTGFIPIINAPEVAILGVSKTTIKPVYIGGEFKPRKMLPVTLSYDHKAVNGVDGGMFADYLVRMLGDIRHLVL